MVALEVFKVEAKVVEQVEVEVLVLEVHHQEFGGMVAMVEQELQIL